MPPGIVPDTLEPAVNLSDPAATAAAAYVLIHLVRAARDIIILWITVNRVDPLRQKEILEMARRDVTEDRPSGD
jgi:hypothetical protein